MRVENTLRRAAQCRHLIDGTGTARPRIAVLLAAQRLDAQVSAGVLRCLRPPSATGPIRTAFLAFASPSSRFAPRGSDLSPRCLVALYDQRPVSERFGATSGCRGDRGRVEPVPTAKPFCPPRVSCAQPFTVELMVLIVRRLIVVKDRCCRHSYDGDTAHGEAQDRRQTDSQGLWSFTA